MRKLIIVAALLGFSAMVGLIGLFVYLGYTRDTLLARPPAHGTIFLLEADFSKAAGESRQSVTEELRDAIRRRFSKAGVRIFWETGASGGIKIFAPIVDKRIVERTRQFISRSGQLELRLVHPRSDELLSQGEGGNEPDYEWLKQEQAGATGRKATREYLVRKTPEIGFGEFKIARAMVMRNPVTSEPEIQFALDKESARAFATVTRENMGRQLAIMMDGVLYSAPVIRQEISQGKAVISGSLDAQGALDVVTALDAAFPVRVRLLETSSY